MIIRTFQLTTDDCLSWSASSLNGGKLSGLFRRTHDALGMRRMIHGTRQTIVCNGCHHATMAAMNYNTSEHLSALDQRILEGWLTVCTSCGRGVGQVWLEGASEAAYYSNMESWFPEVKLTGEEVVGFGMVGQSVIGVVNLPGYKAAWFAVKCLPGWLMNTWGLDGLAKNRITHPWSLGQEVLGYKPFQKGTLTLTNRVARHKDLMVMVWPRTDYLPLARPVLSRARLTDYVHSYFGLGSLNPIETAVLTDFPLIFSGGAQGIWRGITQDEFNALMSEVVGLFPFLPRIRSREDVQKEIDIVMAKAFGPGYVAMKGIWK